MIWGEYKDKIFGTNRTISDADLWFWLTKTYMIKNKGGCDKCLTIINYWNNPYSLDINNKLSKLPDCWHSTGPNDKIRYETIVQNPDFLRNSLEYCRDLLTELDKMIKNGFDMSDLGGQDMMYYSWWNYAQYHLDQNMTITKKAK